MFHGASLRPEPDDLSTAIRILVSFVTAGAGHRRAAEAIAQAAAVQFPGANIQCRDLLEEVPAWWRRAYPATYYWLVRRCSFVWGMCFWLLDTWPVYRMVQPLRRAWNLVIARRFVRALRRSPPDVVIVTHFFPADVVSACKEAGWITTPLVIVVTDLHPHRLWLAPAADAYVCGADQGAWMAQARGVPADRLHVLGIPVAEPFGMVVDRPARSEPFHLDPNRRTVLVTSGGNTVGPFEAVVKALMARERAFPGRMQLLVVCGENRAAVQRLGKRAEESAMPVTVLGFIETMPQAMAASDLIVAKAGGLTVTEALSLGVPLVLYHAIPGQERVNAEHVARHGAAVIALRPCDVASVVQDLLEDPARLAAMRNAARRLSRPHAARDIVAKVVAPLVHAATQRKGAA